MSEIRVAIAGVGNCASALIQGVEYYRNVTEEAKVPGLMHVSFGGYHIQDIKFVAAFEVNRLKIGRDLGEAIFTEPSSCAKFAGVPELGVEVSRGPILDGVAPHTKKPFRAYDERKHKPVSVVDTLREAKADVLVNFLQWEAMMQLAFMRKLPWTPDVHLPTAFLNS